MEKGRYHHGLLKAASLMQFTREGYPIGQLIIIDTAENQGLARLLRFKNRPFLVAGVGGVLDLLQKTDSENRLLPYAPKRDCVTAAA